VVNKYKYSIWGSVTNIQETVPNSFKYAGEFWDDATGLQYLRARWYDPSIGRFINKDTYEGELTNPLSQNLYTYVHNNPLINTDPTGHEALPKHVTEIIKDFQVITGGMAKGAKSGSKGGPFGVVAGIIIGGLFGNPSHAGESQQEINQSRMENLNISAITADEANKMQQDENRNIVYRAVTETDFNNILLGKGIRSKYSFPNKEWSLLQHVTWGGADSRGVDISIGFDPWISTTTSLEVANKFNSGYGIVVIDLNLVSNDKKVPMYEFWGRTDYEGELAYAFGVAEKEISVYKYIPNKAIVGYIP